MGFKLKETTEQGFTLVEVLIALAILAIALLMAATLQTTAISGNKGSSEMNVGTLLGQQVLEQLVAYNLVTNLSPSVCDTCSPNAPLGIHTAATEPNLPPNLTRNGVAYSWNYTVTVGLPNAPGIRTIMMNVQWTDKTSHSVALVERMVP